MPSARTSRFPTADNPRQVARLLEFVASGVRSTRGLQEAMGVEQGAVAASLAAAAWLGFLEPDGDVLTPLGLEYVYAGRQRKAVWARAVWSHPFVEALGSGRGAPSEDDVAAAIAKAEPDLSPADVVARATAVAALLAPAYGVRPRSPDDRQLDLPLLARAVPPPAPRLDRGGREHDPDVYRYLLHALVDNGELSLGQVRALLDRAQANEAPIGGYVDLAIGRGEAVRLEERLVVGAGAVDGRDLADTTTSIILSDPGYRTWLADARAAAAGDRNAAIRRDRLRAKYRGWDRRLFGKEIEPERLEEELRRVLMDRSLESFPVQKGPAASPMPVKAPWLDVWERPGLPIALPPTLAQLQGGLATVNAQLRSARQGAQDVSLPDLSYRPVAVHGGLVHPGEPLPRTVPDVRTLRLRLLMHAPYAALATALLLAHRIRPIGLEVTLRRGAWQVRRDGEPLGELLDLCDAFARSRGHLPSRRRRGGLGARTLVGLLEANGVAALLGPRAVLAERFFVQLRTEAEEMEVARRLQPLADAVATWLQGLDVVEE